MKRLLVPCFLIAALVATRPVTLKAATIYVTASPYNAACDGSTNDHTAIQTAFTAAGTGDTIVFPSGTCFYNDDLILTGKSYVTIVGAGMDSTVLKGNPTQSAIRIEDSDHITISDLERYSEGTSSRGGDWSDGFFFEDVVHLTIDAVRARNTASTGFFLHGVTDAWISNSEVIHSWADGFHLSAADGFENEGIAISNNYAEDTGDDSFSVIGYGSNRNTYVGFYGNTSWYSASSGITVEGAQYVEVHSNYVLYNSPNNSAPAIRVVSGDYWNTGWNDQVDIYDNSLSYTFAGGSTMNQDYWDAAIMVKAENGDNTNIRVRSNIIYSPNIGSNTAAIRMVSANGYVIDYGEVTNNHSSAQSAGVLLRIGPDAGNIAVANNSKNGSGAGAVWVWPYW